MTSNYQRLPVAIGTVALDLMLAVWLSSQLKERMDPRAWRAIHFSSYASFIAAAIHSYLVGTDKHSRWGLIVLGSCVAVVLLATVWRIVGRPERAVGRTALSPLEQSKGR
jgi:hypothetical protein